VFPSVALKIIQRADAADVSLREIEFAIMTDPAIAGKVLKVASSPAYAGSNIDSIGRAIQVLGMQNLKRLVIGLAYQTMLNADDAPVHDRVESWRHGYATGVAAREIARVKAPNHAEQIFASGLMHDMGLLIMEKFLRPVAATLLNMSRADQIPLFECERKVLGWDHAEAGGILGEMWSIPNVVLAGVRYHHDISATDEFYTIAAIISVADTLAHQTGFTNGRVGTGETFDLLAEMELEMPTEELDRIAARMVEEVVLAQAAFGIGMSKAA
jgi:HD-like signal output (HDOD) protein